MLAAATYIRGRDELFLSTYGWLVERNSPTADLLAHTPGLCQSFLPGDLFAPVY